MAQLECSMALPFVVQSANVGHTIHKEVIISLPRKFCNGIISTTSSSSTSTRSGCLSSLSIHRQYSEPAPCGHLCSKSWETLAWNFAISWEAKDCDYFIQSSIVMQAASLSESCQKKKLRSSRHFLGESGWCKSVEINRVNANKGLISSYSVRESYWFYSLCLVCWIQVLFYHGQTKMGISLSQDSKTATHTEILNRKWISMVGEKLTQVNWTSKRLYYRAVIENYCVVLYILWEKWWQWLVLSDALPRSLPDPKNQAHLRKSLLTPRALHSQSTGCTIPWTAWNFFT